MEKVLLILEVTLGLLNICAGASVLIIALAVSIKEYMEDRRR